MRIEQESQNQVAIPEPKTLPEYTLDKLPSGMLAYPKDLVIKYRPYTYGEVKSFNAGTKFFGETLVFALEGVMAHSDIDPTFSKEKLSVADAMFISLHRKLASLGTSTFTCNYTCPHCEKGSSFTLVSDKIEFEELRIPALPVKVNLSGIEYEFTFLTVEAYVRNKIDQQRRGDILGYLASMCQSHPFDVAKKNFYNVTVEEGHVLEELDRLLFHGLKEFPAVCTNCNKNTAVSIEGRDVIIGPFRGPGESVRSRIRFGV